MTYFSWETPSLCQTCNHRCKNVQTLTITSRLIGCPKYKKKDYSYLWIAARRNIKPTRPERILNDITPKSVRYVGDGNKWIKLENGRNKNPDFIVDGQKKIIEVFGNYWHKNDNSQHLVDLYIQVGLKCLVIWENEIYKNPEQVKERFGNFIKQ